MSSALVVTLKGLLKSWDPTRGQRGPLRNWFQFGDTMGNNGRVLDLSLEVCGVHYFVLRVQHNTIRIWDLNISKF